MIRRPISSQFREAVLEGRKFTTIRDKVWPVGKPIMLFEWSGKAYRSKQVDVAPVVVLGFWPIVITHLPDHMMRYEHGMENERPLWSTEGFAMRSEMDAWFRALVKPGQTVTKVLMRFRLAPGKGGK